jgi:mycofactocin system glycosyltransferase
MITGRMSRATPAWRLGPGAHWLDRTTLAGGTPYRVVTLTERGADVVRDLLAGGTPPDQPAIETLLGRLRSGGLLIAPPPAATDHRGVTVVIPARSAPEPVQELLASLPADLPVVLVDDGSPVPLTSLAGERDGLRVLRNEMSRGPAAARNAGAAIVDTEWIAFLDADTIPDPDWIAALRGHGADPADPAGTVVLAAPQIVPLEGSGSGGWFEQRVCALDLGRDPSNVGPGQPVSYVPSAAMLVNAEAFARAGGFNETLHVGEDVDLVWRLLEQGTVRDYPTVPVGHRPRGTLTAALYRRR